MAFYFNVTMSYICHRKPLFLKFLGALLFSGDADSDRLLEEMERAKYDAEMKAVAEEEAAKAQISSQQSEKVGLEKRIREGKDDKVFKVSITW